VIFTYGDKEIAWLSQRDAILGEAISSMGMIHREVYPDLFCGLIRTIIAQQISRQAVKTIWQRLEDLLITVNPLNVLNKSESEIQRCGLTHRKAEYILNAARKVTDGALNITRLHDLTDAEVIRELMQLDGVGLWTAEMLLILSLQRSDILSYGDLGIRKGMMRLYGYESLSRQKFEAHRLVYSPHCSVASLYLWAMSP